MLAGKKTGRRDIRLGALSMAVPEEGGEPTQQHRYGRIRPVPRTFARYAANNVDVSQISLMNYFLLDMN